MRVMYFWSEIALLETREKYYKKILQQILQGEVALQNSKDHLHITTIKVV